MLNVTASSAAARSFTHTAASRAAGLGPRAAQWPQPSVTSARVLAPPARLMVRSPGPDGGGLGGTSLCSRSISCGAAAPSGLRDWPLAGDDWDGARDLTASGIWARRASDQTPPSRREVLRVREAQGVLRGEGVEGANASFITRIGMVRGLECTRDELLATQGSGVGAGLRQLSLQPGDAVGEQDPPDPGLAVCLALEGAHTFITLSNPSRHGDISRELARYRAGTVGHQRQLDSDGLPVRLDSYYAQAAAKAARHLSACQGSGFEALPHDIQFKALISRGVFQHLATPDIEASVRTAARRLMPGGALVFEFAHAAGQPAPATAGVQVNKINFRQIASAIQEAGLTLQLLHITFRCPDNPHQHVIPARRVTAHNQAGICLRSADAAAWSGWDEVFRQPPLHGRRMWVEASGLLLKPEK